MGRNINLKDLVVEVDVRPIQSVLTLASAINLVFKDSKEPPVFTSHQDSHKAESTIMKCSKC